MRNFGKKFTVLINKTTRNLLKLILLGISLIIYFVQSIVQKFIIDFKIIIQKTYEPAVKEILNYFLKEYQL